MSGALDRLHYEKDPCVRYDGSRKVWIYLHRGRMEEDFGMSVCAHVHLVCDESFHGCSVYRKRTIVIGTYMYKNCKMLIGHTLALPSFSTSHVNNKGAW